MKFIIPALALLAAGPALAQRAPAPLPRVEAAPPVDPAAWWENKEPIREPQYDPLANRRANRRTDTARANFNNGVDPALYRLWGLQPLQWLVLRRSEAVYEAWYRPTSSARQAVVRVILRNDGRVFLQARAGLGCCSPEIARRVDIDVELPRETRAQFQRLREDALWSQPRNVVVSEADDAVSTVCVDGASYDVTLVDDRRSAHLRRACDPAELGSISPALQTLIGAALGRDARFDTLFAGQKYVEQASAYQALLADGGRLKAAHEDIAEAPAAVTESTDAASQAIADAVAEIMTADRAFAARSAQTTASQAFREFMDKDGLLFREGGEPVRGADAVAARFGGASGPETGKLLWEPVEAWASEDGTFGASWGRSRFVPLGAAQPTAAYRYMTVWRRDAEGRWKGLMDMGAEATDLLPPKPAAPVQTPSAPR